MTLKDAIAVRQKSRLTQGDVAKLMGITQSTVSSIEGQTGRASVRTIKQYIKVIEQAVVLPQNKPTPEQLVFGFTAPGAQTPDQDELSKMLKQMETMRDAFYAEMEKAKAAAQQPAPTPPVAATPLAIQKAYDSGAEAMREAFIELLVQSVRNLRAPGETIPPGNWSAVSMEVK